MTLIGFQPVASSAPPVGPFRTRTPSTSTREKGTRTLDHDGLRKASAAAKTAKTHYVIVDTIGVTKPLKNARRLARIERMLTDEQEKSVAEKIGGTSISRL